MPSYAISFNLEKCFPAWCLIVLNLIYNIATNDHMCILMYRPLAPAYMENTTASRRTAPGSQDGQ